MPGTDGYQLIREQRRRALRAGFQLHLAKPVQPSELVTVVGSLATRRNG
jgi:CheY-like chemotaxis protein